MIEVFLLVVYNKSLRDNVPCFSRISINRELNQQRRQRLRKRQLQSVFALFLNSLRLFHRISLNSLAIFWSWILEDCIKVQDKKMGVSVHVPCRNRATTAKKCTKQRVKLFFCLSRCHRRLCCLSSQWRFSRNRTASLEACHKLFEI